MTSANDPVHGPIVTTPALSADTGRSSGEGDLSLVRRALAGDEAAIATVLARLDCVAKFVFRLDRSLGTGLPVDVLEDVVQQVFLTVWPRLPGYNGVAALETWVFGFCRNCVRAAGRRRARERRATLHHRAAAVAATEPPVDDVVARQERFERLRDEIERLRPDEREVVVLRHLEGWSFEDIARHTAAAPSTVKDRSYRAMLRLEQRLRRRDASA